MILNIFKNKNFEKSKIFPIILIYFSDSAHHLVVPLRVLSLERVFGQVRSREFDQISGQESNRYSTILEQHFAPDRLSAVCLVSH